MRLFGVSATLKMLARWSGRLPRWVFERWVQLLLDAVGTTFAIVAAFLIRFEFKISPWFPDFIAWIAIIAVLQPLVLLVTKGYRSTWRYFHLSDGFELALKSSPLMLGIVVFRFFHGFGRSFQPLPYSVAVLEFTLFILFAGGIRILRRLTSNSIEPTNDPAYRTLLVSDEESLAGAVRLVEPYPDVQLAGIITDDRGLRGHTVAGVRVLGGPESLQRNIIAHRIQLVLMASGTIRAADEIVQSASELGVQVRILPTARDLVRGRVRVSHLLKADNLGNKLMGLASDPDPSVVACFENRCVLVTGAGGSIGSEIARQASKLPLSCLVLLDQDENSIFELSNELGNAHVPVISYVGDIRDAGLLKQLFSSHEPQIVIHAAAYKHVPVMEANVCEAVLNNVAGTRQLVDMAETFNCERFVMISTDKAVHPRCVMGATKRTAEVLIQHRAMHGAGKSGTQFACVRFGNVMGSRGSVAPIFLRQIAAGGPVTVTHEQMTRYFMSIHQAVQLVLQAATLASEGDIYMLDMGDPIRIMDFARQLIRMSGLVPERDIPIQIVGARPGEKIHEQLWCEDAEVSRTDFRYVFRVKAEAPPHGVANQIASLERAAATRAESSEILALFQSLPIDYNLDGERPATVPFPRNGSSADVILRRTSGGD